MTQIEANVKEIRIKENSPKDIIDARPSEKLFSQQFLEAYSG